MNKINKKDIDCSELKIVENLSLGLKPSTFYIDKNNEKLYKFYPRSEKRLNELKEKKIIKFDELDLDFISKPTDLIYDNESLIGNVQDYIEGDTLQQAIYKKGLLEEIKNILEASKQLEELHNNGVIMDYVHFGNIMVDENDKTHFISTENYKIDGLESTGTTLALNNYYGQKGKPVPNDVNSDVIGFYLSLFDRIFARDIFCVNTDSYNTRLGAYPFLNTLYPVFMDLSKRTNSVPEVPYLHKALKNYENK